MTRKEIIDGLKFTVEMFLLDPSTGETITEPRNDMDKITIDACRGAIKLLEQNQKDKKYCKDCVHLNVDRITIDKNGKIRGGGVCYNNKKACRCYPNTKLTCVFSRQACANFEPKESEDK